MIDVTKIPYTDMVEYYNNIIRKIYHEINEGTHESYWDNEKQSMIYSDEYLNAYGYLQRADWRLSDVESMSEYYKETNFFYFGLEHLSDVRHRLQHYLESTDFNFSDEIYDYNKYDDIIIDFYKPYRLKAYNKGETDWFNYYMKIMYFESAIDHFRFELKMTIRSMKEVCEILSSKENYDKINKENLKKIIKSVEEFHSDIATFYLDTEYGEDREKYNVFGHNKSIQ